MPLSPGFRLGPYEVVGPLGAGGMGEVYRARDPRLGRDVAIKVLPEAFALDAERLARFQREAQVLASLNHPHIAQIHGIEESGGTWALVLELVEGPTLAERIIRGPVPVAESLEICAQIASAVEAAHEGGVVHRDLKPGNVKITPDGQVKVLDFGLAKGGSSPGSSDVALTHSPTRTFAATGAGVILGTAAYMSPEQARGKPLDRRTDIWSFGCVLYECLTGSQAFEGETISDMIARILERDPDWSALPANTPARVRELLARCLEKDAKKRLRDIGDARLEIENVLSGRTLSGSIPIDAAVAAPAVRASLGRRLLPGAIGLVLGAAIALAAARYLGGGPPAASRSVSRVSVSIPKNVRLTGPIGIAANGSVMAMVGNEAGPDGGSRGGARIYIRNIGLYDFDQLPGSEGVVPFISPQVSEDGAAVLFIARPLAEGSVTKLFRAPLDGRTPPVAIREWGGDWGGFCLMRGGDLLVMTGSGTAILRVPAGGGPPGQVIPITGGAPNTNYRGLDRGSWLDDTTILLDAITYGPDGWFTGTAAVDTRTGKATTLLDDGGKALYLAPGRLVFTRTDALLVAPFDARRLTVTGEPAAVLGGLRTANSYEPAPFRVLSTGALMYLPGGKVGADRKLVILKADGSVETAFPDARAFREPHATPDGRHVLVTATNARGLDEIWGADEGTSELRRLVSVPGADCYLGNWAPDGERFAFAMQRGDDSSGVYIKRADDPADARTLVLRSTADARYVPSSWSPDGSRLLVVAGKPGPDDVMSLTFLPDGSSRLEPFVATRADESYGAFSPDGRFALIFSDESGQPDLYVCSIRPDGSAGPLVPVARDEVTQFFGWIGDGPRVVHGTSPATIRFSSVSAGGRPVVTPAGNGPDLSHVNFLPAESWWIPDGRILAVLQGKSEDVPDRFELVQNWTEELAARLGEKARARK